MLGSALATDTVNYSYDAAGRLVSARYNGGKNVAYTYDPTGNLTRRSITTFVDTDGDGMDDNWEIAHFGNLSRDGTGDFDGDGMSDLAEYLAGTDPTNANSYLKVTAITTGGGGALITWGAISGKNYRLQYKDDVEANDWYDILGDVTAASNSASKTDTSATNSVLRFYRVILLP